MYQIYPRCTQFCDCCTVAPPFFFPSACLCCPGHLHILLLSCSMLHACPLSCLPPFIFTEFNGQLCTFIVTHPIHAMHSLFRLQPFSFSSFLRYLCVPIFSLSVHLICHLLHVPSVIQFSFFFKCFCTPSSFRIPCYASYVPYAAPIAIHHFSSSGASQHPHIFTFYAFHMHHYSTTASASKPLNLSFLHVPLSFFQLSLTIPTFNFLLSVFFISHFLCE